MRNTTKNKITSTIRLPLHLIKGLVHFPKSMAHSENGQFISFTHLPFCVPSCLTLIFTTIRVFSSIIFIICGLNFLVNVLVPFTDSTSL